MNPEAAPLDTLQLAAATGALAALPYGLFVASREAFTTLRGLPPEAQWANGVAIALGAMLRATLPRRIVTVFLGYAATRHAIELLPLSRYGAGTTVVHAAWLALFGHHHRVILAGNAIVGALALPLWTAVFQRWTDSPRLAAVSTWLLALTPVFLRNDTSDSNNVVPLALLAVALLASDATERGSWRRERRLAAVAPAVVLVTLARPDFVVLVPVAFAVHRRWQGGWRAPWALAAVLELVHALLAARDLAGRGSLPIARTVLGVPLSLAFESAFVTPAHFPVVLTILVLWNAWRGPDQARALARRHGLAALALMAPTVADLTMANAARVHVPAATLLAPALAASLLAPARAALRGALVAAMALSALPGAWALFRRINDDHEEALIRDAAARTPAVGSILLRPGHDDRYPDFERGRFVHYEFPDYLFPRALPQSLGAFLAAPDFSRPVFFFHGLRCHARGRDHGTPPPPGDTLHPACAAMHARFVLEPVVERTVPNEGDHAFPWYPAAPRFSLGFYRVVGPRQGVR